MGHFYISIEKNTEAFEMYRTLWEARGIEGIQVESMTEGIKKAIEIESSETDELVFVDIVADDIDFLPQLKILSQETGAPILIATSNPNDAEHHAALNNGADYYAKYSEEAEMDINGVLSAINSMNQRSVKKKPARNIMTHGDILIAGGKIFIKDKELTLSGTELKILQYLMENHGQVLEHEQICRMVYGDDDVSSDRLYSAMKRLRKKIRDAAQSDYIQTIRDVGYRLSTKGEEH